MDLEKIAGRMSSLTMGECCDLLESIGRREHIKYDGKVLNRLTDEEPERLKKIGSRTINRETFEGTDEEYDRECISSARYLYEYFPIIFEFYDELMNGIVYQEEKEELEYIAGRMSSLTMGECCDLLESIGRREHIKYDGKVLNRLTDEEPERLKKIGSRTINRETFEGTDEEYDRECISSARYLYEYFPIIFEFYDELMNGIVHQDDHKEIDELINTKEDYSFDKNKTK